MDEAHHYPDEIRSELVSRGKEVRTAGVVSFRGLVAIVISRGCREDRRATGDRCRSGSLRGRSSLENLQEVLTQPLVLAGARVHSFPDDNVPNGDPGKKTSALGGAEQIVENVRMNGGAVEYLLYEDEATVSPG